MTLSRRTFLVSVGGALGAGAVAEGMAARARRRPVLAWAAQLSGPAAARDLGVEYLTRHPAEAERDVLLGHLAGLVPRSVLFGDGTGAVAGFNARLRQDFAEGDIVWMGGWLLSRTELRLCALMAVDEDEQTGSRGIFAPSTLTDGTTVSWTAPTASFTLAAGGAPVEFRVRSGAPDPQRLGIRVNGETIDERAVWGAEWQQVRYVARETRESPVVVELTVTPEWRPRRDFRTIGVGLDRVP
jgi:hypothetical protein